MAAKETPVMQQHALAKRAHPDCIIFFRLGDFYEMFGDDALVASRVLELTLTSRNKGKPDEIPMAGLPHHAAHGYIAKLLEKGHKVAVCEQMADPATVKGIVPREVVRVITPGTWTEGDQLKAVTNNWLCAIVVRPSVVGVALLDLSTAELLAAELPDVAALLSELGRTNPREVLVVGEDSEGSLGNALAEVLPRAAIRNRVLTGSETSLVASRDLLIASSEVTREAAGLVLSYAGECLPGETIPVFRAGVWNTSGLLRLDRAAQRHLELVESTVNEEKATLLHVIDRTRTPGGARLLRRRLLAPLLDVREIRRRLGEIEAFVTSGPLRAELAEALSEVTDLERLSVRVTLGEAAPRDLGAIRRGLEGAREVIERLGTIRDPEARACLGLETLPDLVPEVCSRLVEALVERPPAQAKEGAIFRPGFDSELDRLSELRTRGSDAMTDLEERLRRETGIGNLRVRFTRVFGWYVEVSRGQVGRVPDAFRRKQTVAGGERFTTDELDELSYRITHAETDFRVRELALLEDLYAFVAKAATRIHALSVFLSAVDVAVGLADLAVDSDYCRPEVDDGDVLRIVDGRHPVVERLAARGKFVPNDTELVTSGAHLWLITGPNMAGKSTFLRQVALIVILAQMGSFVPAKAAQIGLVDCVLSRVGASDNLAFGESTFMVEMRETSNILRSATKRSLVILDEVGRGTSTFDGLSIAWAVVEYLDQVVGCRALFATHYHELTELGSEEGSCRNYSVTAREHEGEVIFLHRVNSGAASRSYGIAVARLAGVPEIVLSRAKALLGSFEEQVGALAPRPRAPVGRKQLDLFAPPSSDDPNAKDVLATLRAVDVDRLTGIDALTMIAQLKKKLIY